MNLITLQITPGDARRIYKIATPELRTILEGSASAGFFSEKLTDRIKSYEDACAELGIEPINEAEMLSNGFRQDEIDRRKLETITYVFNDNEYVDWNNSDQRKYYPWFKFEGSGFAFFGTYCAYSFAHAGCAFRLCFKRDADARYAGQQFLELYKSIIDNNPKN